MDINRPLGTGRDADNNGTVEEPTASELAAQSQANPPNPSSLITGYKGVPPKLNLANGLNVTGPSPSDKKYHVNQTDELMARQLLARHLYVLARMMIDDKFLGDPTTGTSKNANNHWFDNDSSVVDGPSQYKASVRRLAQWAVNVVDFMDSDSIMTPFEYDLYPFSPKDPSTGQFKDLVNPGSGQTWCVDGIIDDGSGTVSQDDGKPWRGLVWGCERPELLITEVFAFHDRRTEDTDNEAHVQKDDENTLLNDGDTATQAGKTTDTMDKHDGSFDQRLMPALACLLSFITPGERTPRLGQRNFTTTNLMVEYF